MNYKETLFFIAKCLTISLEAKNRKEIEKQLKSTTIDWDTVVKLSTAHYVFPALYYNLKRADFLHYLPHELVSYMEYIAKLNTKRNKQIVSQAKELNTLLLVNNIRPIFLKGTANLLAGVYEDIGERMVGDIDFIFSQQDYSKAITILKDFGYSLAVKTDYNFPIFKHYPKMKKENSIASVEIHKEILLEKYASEFNYDFIAKDCQIIEGISVLSYANKLNLSIIANQINDNGFYYKTMALRNAYDVFLLSKKTNAKAAVNTLDKLSHPLNCFLAACYEVFHQSNSLIYTHNKKTIAYLNSFQKQFVHPKATNRKHKSIQIYFFIKKRLNTIFKSIVYKDYRIWLYRRLTDKNWYNEKMIQLGFTDKTTK